MTDLPAGLGAAAAGVLGGAGDLLGGVADGATQVVAQAGDTLATIAGAAGAPLADVIAANPQVLHPDLVQPGQLVTVPAPAAGEGEGPGGALPDPAVDVAEAALGPAVQDAGAAAAGVLQTGDGALAAAGPGLGLAVGTPAPLAGAVEASEPGAVAGTVAFGAEPGPLAGSAGAPDFRVLGQTLTPSAGAPAPSGAASAPTLLQSLGRINPALAGLVAAALASPTGTAAASAPQLARLEAALLTLGWSPSALALAKPGDVLLLLRAALLQAVPVGDQGAAAWTQEGTPLAADPAVRTLGPPVMATLAALPPGVDAALAGRRRDGSVPARRKPAGDGSDAEGGSSESPQRAWIARALAAAMAVKARWGVPVAVTLAHGALASDWGRWAPDADFFGLGGRAPSLASGGTSRALVRFGGLDEAADAFGAVLAAEPAFALAFRARDPATFARRLGEAGFTRDPGYGDRMGELIQTYGLGAFDAGGA